MAIGLSGVFWLGLAPPFVSALLMFCLVLAIHKLLLSHFNRVSPLWSILMCSLFALLLLFLAGFGIFGLLDTKTGIPAMAKSLTSAIEFLRETVPSLAVNIPSSSEALFNMGISWIQTHLNVLTSVGAKLTKLAFHVVIGLLVGALAANAWLRRVQGPTTTGLSSTMLVHLDRFRNCFEKVVFAQVYIAVTNAFFTGVFLAWIMPGLGFEIPFVKTLSALTFLLGLIPILGNIVSNTLICGVALTVSPTAAGIALAFLVIIHKLEYFLNAWIMGSKIKVQSYEILAAMLIMESLFGLWGLALSPVLYAYIKDELRVAEQMKLGVQDETGVLS